MLSLVVRSFLFAGPALAERLYRRHIFFHAFTASVAQSALVVTSPKSMLAQHAWGQLNIAVEIFEEASVGGAPVAMLFPRVQALRDNAFASLQAAETIPMGIGDSRPSPDAQGVVSDENLSILGPATRLSRRPARVSHLDGSRDMDSQSPEAASGEHTALGSASAQAAATSLCDEYSPFDKLQPYGSPPVHPNHPAYQGATYQPDYSSFMASPPTPSYSTSPSAFAPPDLSPLDAFLQAQAQAQSRLLPPGPPQSIYAPLQQSQLFSLPPQPSPAQLQQQQLLASLPGFGYPQMVSPNGAPGVWEFPAMGMPMQSMYQSASMSQDPGATDEDWKMCEFLRGVRIRGRRTDALLFVCRV